MQRDGFRCCCIHDSHPTQATVPIDIGEGSGARRALKETVAPHSGQCRGCKQMGRKFVCSMCVDFSAPLSSLTLPLTLPCSHRVWLHVKVRGEASEDSGAEKSMFVSLWMVMTDGKVCGGCW